MKPAFISILALLAVVPAKSTDIGKDGFNFYKDDKAPVTLFHTIQGTVPDGTRITSRYYLRAKSDDVGAEGPLEDRLLYFYRTPLPLYPGLLPTLEQEYRKRTGNAFKNHMLSKELWASEREPPSKRSSKTALSLLMQGKHPYLPNGRYCPYGK